MYIIGIDGGGTKTTAAVATLEGETIATATVGPTNPNSLEHSYIKRQFDQLFDLLQKQLPDLLQGAQACFAGVAGADRPSNKQLLQNILTNILPEQTSIQVDNDAVNALYSGTSGEPGIVNIAGTGSISFGINEHGHRQRAGGWGYLIGDPGSGYAIGREGLIAFFNAIDGCTEKTMLTELIYSAYNTNNPFELMEHIYDLERSRTVIASVTKLVFQAADQGDATAMNIIEQAAKNMVKQIKCLLSQLYKHRAGTDVSVPIVLTGGIYQRSDWLLPTIEQEFKEYQIKTNFIMPTEAPVSGALTAARKLIQP